MTKIANPVRRTLSSRPRTVKRCSICRGVDHNMARCPGRPAWERERARQAEELAVQRQAEERAFAESRAVMAAALRTVPIKHWALLVAQAAHDAQGPAARTMAPGMGRLHGELQALGRGLADVEGRVAKGVAWEPWVSRRAEA